MSKFQRSFRQLAVLLSLILLVTACGQTGTTGTTGATTAAGGESAATSAPAGDAAAATSPAEEATTAPAEEAATAPAAGESAATTAPAAGGGTVSIGSKDFTEAILVAELYAQVLENAGVTVERKLNLGGTPVAQAALESGEIDLYPEYTSTGLLTVLKQEPLKDAQEIFNAVKTGYEEQFQLTWLEPSPFNDTQGLATTQAIADQYGIQTYTDLSTKAGELRIGGPAEFAEREDGIKGLQATYGGFEFREFIQLGTGPLRYDALKNGDIDVVVVFTTDARIAADDLVVLEDDKTLYPIYNIAPVVRQDTLAANPVIETELNKLAPLLTDEVITGLNAQVDIEGQEIAAVATAFLQEQGLVQ